FQAEDGIRDFHVTGVQTCALPISALIPVSRAASSTVAPRTPPSVAARCPLRGWGCGASAPVPGPERCPVREGERRAPVPGPERWPLRACDEGAPVSAPKRCLLRACDEGAPMSAPERCPLRA